MAILAICPCTVPIASSAFWTTAATGATAGRKQMQDQQAAATESRQDRRTQQDAQRAAKMAAAMHSPCEMLLVRHGETDWNKERRLQGQQQPGPPLNELGWQQAELVCQVLQQRHPHVDAVFSSDLLRTSQTAQVLAAPYNLQVQQHSGLRERHLGLLQGLTYDEAPRLQPAAWTALQSSSSSSRVPGGGESLDELRARMLAALSDIAARHRGQRVVVVSHGAALHSVHRAARGYQAKGKVINCGISVLLIEPAEQTCTDPAHSCSSPLDGGTAAAAAAARGDGASRSCSSSGQSGCRDALLSLTTWNDGHLLSEKDLLGAAGISGAFGGSAREG